MSAKKQKHEMIIPPDAESDKHSLELARVWASGGKQYVTLRTDVWDDPAAWGLMLVDLARHAANAFAEDKGYDVNRVLARIKEGFDGEWAKSDPNRRGNTHLVSGNSQRELFIPAEAQNDESARELVRIWEADDRQHVILDARLWKDPYMWGVMLVDVAHHAVKSFTQSKLSNAAVILARIKEGVDMDWDDPAENTSGHLL